MRPDSFSEKIRKDISKIHVRSAAEWEAEVAAMILCAHSGRVGSDGRIQVVHTRSPSFADRFIRLTHEKKIGVQVKENQKKQGIQQLSTDQAGYAELMRIAEAFRARSITDAVSSSARIRRAVLRGAFMACGNSSDPERAYRIEWIVGDPLFAQVLTLLMHAENIEPQSIRRGAKTILYLKESARIADYLAMIGAHVSLLQFENIRANKEIRNQVNRVVNCDTANAKRQAEAGARRGERLKDLLSSEEVTHLPKELTAAAEVLINNPGLSIKELGALMDPPIGKSGMYHRLQKLERYANETRPNDIPI